MLGAGSVLGTKHRNSELCPQRADGRSRGLHWEVVTGERSTQNEGGTGVMRSAAGKAEKGRRAVKASQQDVQRPWGAFTSRSTLCVTGINLDTGVGGRVGGGAPA